MTTIPPDIFPDTPAVTLLLDGVERRFDVDEETLPDWVEDQVLTSGGFPYDKKMKREEYESTLLSLQVELVRMQAWMKTTGARIVILFEGRDAAGKGGTIAALHENLNPRTARNVALPKPTEAEQGQWYFQRYVSHLPTRGELVSFDRSWYNRAGVEPVMGFCTPEQHERFLDATPHFERLLVEDGIHFFKFWLEIGRETQLKRFYDRRQSILKSWKFSPIDIAGLTRWDDYTAMRDLMFERTHNDTAPWTVIRSNDKRRARIEAVRAVLSAIPYEGRDTKQIGKPDKKIIGRGKKLLTPG